MHALGVGDEVVASLAHLVLGYGCAGLEGVKGGDHGAGALREEGGGEGFAPEVRVDGVAMDRMRHLPDVLAGMVVVNNLVDPDPQGLQLRGVVPDERSAVPDQ